MSFLDFLIEGMQDKLIAKYGLTQVSNSLGFSEKDEKWYGWSHRAIFGFKIGDKIFEPDFGDENTHFDKHGSKDCKTLDDCKRSARAFADDVS